MRAAASDNGSSLFSKIGTVSLSESERLTVVFRAGFRPNALLMTLRKPSFCAGALFAVNDLRSCGAGGREEKSSLDALYIIAETLLAEFTNFDAWRSGQFQAYVRLRVCNLASCLLFALAASLALLAALLGFAPRWSRSSSSTALRAASTCILLILILLGLLEVPGQLDFYLFELNHSKW